MQEGTQGTAANNSGIETQQEGQTNQQAQEKILSLDSLAKFQFEGKEWTPQELKKSYMLHRDYTQKTQKIAEQAKYTEALKYDLKRVVKDPSLAEEFMRVYPKEYHHYLEVIDEISPQKTRTQHSNSKDSLPPELMQRLERVEGYLRQKEVQVAETQIEQVITRLNQKYPDVAEEEVMAKAQLWLERNGELKPEDWERIYKSIDQRIESIAEKRQKAKLEAKLKQNAKSPDVGRGGGTPGTAPKKMTFKEAEEAMIKHLQGR